MSFRFLLLFPVLLTAVASVAGCDEGPASDDCVAGCREYASTCSAAAASCTSLCSSSVGEMAGRCVDDFRTGNLAANITAECTGARDCLASARAKEEN